MQHAARLPGVKDIAEGSWAPRELLPSSPHIPSLFATDGPLWCLICSAASRGIRHGQGWVPLTVVLGTVDDAHATLWAVVGEHQDVKEVPLCWIALQDLLVNILHCL